jgi:hypothetical protein
VKLRSFPPTLPSVNNVATFDVPDAHAIQPSYRNGLLGTLVTWKRIATRRSRSSWKSFAARGGNRDREYGGSASSAMPPLSTDHLSVLDVVMGGVTSALDRRKYSYIRRIRMPPLTTHRVKKVKKEEKFDPELVAAVEAKLRELGVESDVLT